jgi:ubiquitin-conjugating enzyme E2 I
LKFSESFPITAPQCIFTPPIPHPNIFPSGAVCLSILSYDWKPAITVKQILLGIQELLGDPNLKSPANQDMYLMFREKRSQYEANAKAFSARFKAQK